MQSDRSSFAIRLILIILILKYSGGGFLSPSAITSATYVYEKDQTGGVPPGVQFALREINLVGKVSAAAIEADVVDSTGSTPSQYKIAVEAAKAAGLPALVVQAGQKVVKTVSAPLTAEQVQEAVK
jgi:hypothetical protein